MVFVVRRDLFKTWRKIMVITLGLDELKKDVLDCLNDKGNPFEFYEITYYDFKKEIQKIITMAIKSGGNVRFFNDDNPDPEGLDKDDGIEITLPKRVVAFLVGGIGGGSDRLSYDGRTYHHPTNPPPRDYEK